MTATNDAEVDALLAGSWEAYAHTLEDASALLARTATTAYAALVTFAESWERADFEELLRVSNALRLAALIPVLLVRREAQLFEADCARLPLPPALVRERVEAEKEKALAFFADFTAAMGRRR